jgi:hypothetical protein
MNDTHITHTRVRAHPVVEGDDQHVLALRKTLPLEKALGAWRKNNKCVPYPGIVRWRRLEFSYQMKVMFSYDVTGWLPETSRRSAVMGCVHGFVVLCPLEADTVAGHERASMHEYHHWQQTVTTATATTTAAPAVDTDVASCSNCLRDSTFISTSTPTFGDTSFNDGCTSS